MWLTLTQTWANRENTSLWKSYDSLENMYNTSCVGLQKKHLYNNLNSKNTNKPPLHHHINFYIYSSFPKIENVISRVFVQIRTKITSNLKSIQLLHFSDFSISNKDLIKEMTHFLKVQWTLIQSYMTRKWFQKNIKKFSIRKLFFFSLILKY